MAAARWITVRTAQRAPEHPRVGELAEVPQHDSHLDPQATELPRIADQNANLRLALKQLRQQGAADCPRRPGDQDHVLTLKCVLRSIGRRARHPATRSEVITRLGLRHRRAVHRSKGQLLRRGLPGRLHPPDSRRAGLRQRRAALYRPRRVHRLRCLRRGLPVDACFAEDQLPDEWAKYTPINAEYYSGK